MITLVLPTPADIRAARGFLDWKQSDLAFHCDVNVATIIAIENSQSKPKKELLDKIAEVFMERGLKFQPQGGFVADKNVVMIYEGREGLLKVLEDVLQTCSIAKDEVLFLGSDDGRSSDEVIAIFKRIYEMKIPCKQLISDENNYILGPLEDYKQVDENLFLSKDAVIIYKDKVIFFLQREGDLDNYVLSKVKNIIMNDKELAEMFRKYFYRLWNKGKKIVKSEAKQIYYKKK